MIFRSHPPRGVVEGDILDVSAGVILHQVNCLGKTGGLAGALREAFPDHFVCYDKAISASGTNWPRLLGRAKVGYVADLAVAHCFGQLGYGRDKVYTDMAAVADALAEARAIVGEIPALAGSPVYAPYQMGCGRAGGDWERYLDLLYKYFPRVTIIRNSRYAVPERTHLVSG